MKTISESTRWAFGLCAAASLLAGCGAATGQRALPPAVQQNTPERATPNGWGHGHNGSWMDPQAKHEDLIYVSDTRSGDVTVYAWKGRTLVGKLAGIPDPYGLCSDKSGNVWIVSWGNNQILEYAHAGTKVLRVLSPHDPQADLYDCSVDPTTGNLAVTNWGDIWYQGDVLVYAHASGTPKTYTGYGLWFYYGCSYDDRGNLFADGWDAYINDNFSLAELPRGASAFTRLTLLPDISPLLLGGVQWDGRYVAIGNMGYVYTYNVRGHYAHLKSLTSLTSDWPVGLFWISDIGGQRSIVAPDFAGNPTAIQKWNYPAGGAPNQTITQNVNRPFGVTVSKAAPWQ